MLLEVIMKVEWWNFIGYNLQCDLWECLNHKRKPDKREGEKKKKKNIHGGIMPFELYYSVKWKINPGLMFS